jgi:asparagine synthase (glutamine-hydrolysing)
MAKTFNYGELRSKTEVAVHRFYTHTDSEVIAHLYEECGNAFVERCNGRFATALSAEELNQLLSVSEIGESPVRFAADRGTEYASFLFCPVNALH